MRLFPAVFAGFGLASPLSIADTAVTTPIGAYVIKVPGKGTGEAQRRTYFGMQLLPAKVFSGFAETVSGKRVSSGGGGFDHTTVATAGHRSYVHVLSGAGRGFVTEIEEFRTAEFVCSDDLSGWITPGTQFAIRPHANLADVLGATNRFLLGAGTDAAVADNVVLWDPDAQEEKVYYFHSGRGRWEEAGVEADAGGVSVRFPFGLYIVRRTDGTRRIALTGDLASDPVLLPVKSGPNVFSLPVNLGASLNLMATTGAYPVVSGANAREADLLVFEEPTSGVRRGPFYRSSRPGAEGWREAGVNGGGAASTSLDLLSTLILHRQGNGGYVLAEGNASGGGSFPPLPPDVEPGEAAVSFSLPVPFHILPPDVTLMVETSQNLQTWTNYVMPAFNAGQAICELPAGQSRAFYRLKITFSN